MIQEESLDSSVSLDGIVEIKDDEVNVVEIMRQIRERIRQRGAIDPGSDRGSEQSNGVLDAGVNYHMEEANIWHDKIYVDDQIRTARSPLGLVLARLRRPAHDLVRFYINRMCDKQVAVNSHLIRAFGALASEVSRNKGQAEEIRMLREEVQALRKQVEELKCQRGR